MANQRHPEFSGTKISYKESKEAADGLSVIVRTKDGRRFKLLPGKTRGDVAGTELVAKTPLGNSRVKKAMDEKGHVLAVKCIYEDEKPETQVIDELAKLNQFDIVSEYKILKAMGDEHAELVFVTVKKNGGEYTRAYLFQELVKGKPLCTRNNEEGIFPDAIKKYRAESSRQKRVEIIKNFITIISKIFDLIEEMHKKGVVHCDLNDSNVMWDEQSGSGKIIDFGQSFFDKDRERLAEYKNLDDARRNDFEKLINYIDLFFDVALHKYHRTLDNDMKRFVECIKATHNRLTPSENSDDPFRVDVEAEKMHLKNFADMLDRELRLENPQYVPAKISRAVIRPNRFYTVCRAIRDFFKDKWQKLCKTLSCCAVAPEANQAEHQTLLPRFSSYSNQLRSVVGGAGRQTESKRADSPEPTEEDANTFDFFVGGQRAGEKFKTFDPEASEIPFSPSARTFY